MYCPVCRQRLADNARRCPNCGKLFTEEERQAILKEQAAAPPELQEEKRQENPAEPADSVRQENRTETQLAGDTTADQWAKKAMVLALIGLVAVWIPVVGVIGNGIGVWFAVKAQNAVRRKKAAVSAMILSAALLLLALVLTYSEFYFLMHKTELTVILDQYWSEYVSGNLISGL